MDVPLIQMDPEDAQQRLEAYRGSLRRSADEEYSAAVAGYEALATGTPVIQLSEAIKSAPRDETGRPMIGLARSDRNEVKLRWDGNSTRISYDTSKDFRQSVFESSLLICRVNIGRTHGQRVTYTTDHGERWYHQSLEGYAMVPMIPPHAVAAAGGRTKLRKHLVLWEVEEWADNRHRTEPDLDPLLLRPIHGDLCAVVAAWDLTDLERAIMAGRGGI